MPDSTRIFVVDANVLIDYAKTDEGILELAAKHLGPLLIPIPTLDEVDQLSVADCDRLGLRLEQPTTEQLLEAGSKSGRLSFQDWLCFIVARDQHAVCVTSEKALRTACLSAGISTLWGLELMLELIRSRCLSAEIAIEIAREIHWTNPFITTDIVRRFRKKARAIV